MCRVQLSPNLKVCMWSLFFSASFLFSPLSLYKIDSSKKYRNISSVQIHEKLIWNSSLSCVLFGVCVWNFTVSAWLWNKTQTQSSPKKWILFSCVCFFSVCVCERKIIETHLTARKISWKSVSSSSFRSFEQNLKNQKKIEKKSFVLKNGTQTQSSPKNEFFSRVCVFFLCVCVRKNIDTFDGTYNIEVFVIVSLLEQKSKNQKKSKKILKWNTNTKKRRQRMRSCSITHLRIHHLEIWVRVGMIWGQVKDVNRLRRWWSRRVVPDVVLRWEGEEERHHRFRRIYRVFSCWLWFLWRYLCRNHGTLRRMLTYRETARSSTWAFRTRRWDSVSCPEIVMTTAPYVEFLFKDVHRIFWMNKILARVWSIG